MKGLRLYLELAVVVSVGAFAYARLAPRWNGFFSPLKPAEAVTELPPSAPEPGERPGHPAPPLAPPAPSGMGRPRGPGEAMLVVPEGTRETSEGYEGSAVPALNGAAPRVFERAPIAKDSLALERTAPAAAAREPAWLAALRSLDPRYVLAAVVALFALLYFLGVSALRRGPGGKGFTHD